MKHNSVHPPLLVFKDDALELNPVLGDAVGAKVDALIYLGKEDQALNLVLDTLKSPGYFYRRISKADLVSKGIYLMMERNQLAGAEPAG